jgi:hypothetical protein
MMYTDPQNATHVRDLARIDRAIEGNAPRQRVGEASPDPASQRVILGRR